jgi:hypothetical protein
MTTKQSWAIFLKTGYDVRGCNLSQGQIDQIFQGTLCPSTIEGAIKKKEAGKPKQDFQAIYNEARQAGLKAGNECVPVPMVVTEHANPLDDNSPVVKRYAPITSGVCGFGWISIKGNTAFARWAKENKLVGNHYPSGYSFWVSDFNQSMEMKEAYAYAFAAVLNKHGIEAHAGSRMD